jgi:uncharacterized repeat protein (TIGR01451 family)
VQSTNVRVSIYNKTGTRVLGPSLQSSAFFAGLPAGNSCRAGDDGDPVVLYDSHADRWMISQFEVDDVPGHQCIAISTTPDPTGSYYAYDFVMPSDDFQDYPHYGVWSDGYYLTTNQFNQAGTAFLGAGIFAFDRVKMLAGDPTAGYVYKNVFTVDQNAGGILPTDLDGFTPPPAGLPNRLMEFRADEFGNPTDAIRTYELVPNYANPAASTFTVRNDITLAPFDARTVPDNPNTGTDESRNVIEQIGGTALDSIADRLMFRLAYRNLGTAAAPQNSWVGNFTVNVSGVNPTTAGTYQTGIRWFELRSTDASTLQTVRDQGTHNLAPGNGATGANNWMGSAAQDNQGHIALGFSQSSTTQNANIMIAARTSASTGVGLDQGEGLFFAAGGAQSSSGGRWGDYSAMSVDPVDECTFWFTTEYYAANSSGSWSTRIGKFVLPGCTPPPKGFIAANITNCANGQPVAGAIVTVDGGFLRTTTATGALQSNIGLPPGTYTASATKPTYTTATSGSLVVTDGGTATFNGCIVGAPSLKTAGGPAITAENYVPVNNAADPGETLTVNLPVMNIGGGDTANLTATLQPTGGVTLPGAPQSYGVVVAGGPVKTKPFTFTASGSCGGIVTLSVALTDGAANLGTLTYTMNLGTRAVSSLPENFDAITVPALPSGWTTSASGGQSVWSTASTLPSSAPNTAVSAEAAAIGDNALVTPVFTVPAAGAQLSFKNLFNLESGSSGYDGMVLELSVNGGAFADITTGGNAFTAGGYTMAISSQYSSPIAGRQAWSGLSGGTGAAPTYITSTINLPATANGQPVQLKWRVATDDGVAASGESGARVDDVVITNNNAVCAAPASNTAPNVTGPSTQSINEDGVAGPFNVTVGDTETPVASLVLSATSNNTALVPNNPANLTLGGSGATRTLQVTPVANASGTATITLTVTDGGSLTGTSTFDVVVAAVNDAPSFTILGNRSHAAGAVGAQNVPAFVTATNFGPGENAQTVLGYTVTEQSDPNGIVSGAAIAANGTLTYTLSGQGGTATIRAVLQDSGGTANGGVDASAPVDFTITAIAGADLSVAINDGMQSPMAGATLAYVVDVANAGPATVNGATVVVTPPAALTGVTWTCTAVMPVACANASGTGPINELVTLAAGQTIRYTLSGTATGAQGTTLTTTATVTAPAAVTEIGSGANNASDVDTIGGDAVFKDSFE